MSPSRFSVETTFRILIEKLISTPDALLLTDDYSKYLLGDFDFYKYSVRDALRGVGPGVYKWDIPKNPAIETDIPVERDDQFIDWLGDH